MRLIASDIIAERGGRVVLRDISFSVAAGELLAITGPNGAGKSTLLRVLAGLLAPVAGEIRIEPGSDLPRQQQIHYFGHLDGLKPALTVADNLTFWRRLADEPDLGVLDALDAVGLEHLDDTPALYLSAGQRRRVAIARLLVARRPIWLLDEPTTALDAASEARFGELVAAHLGRGGLAIAASHQTLPIAPAATLALGVVV